MKKSFTTLFLILCSLLSYSQNVGIGTTTPNSSAALEIKDSTRGFLPPRMTTAQRNAIANPAEGLQIFNTTTKCLQIFAYGFWQNIYCAQSASPNNTTGVADIDGNNYDTIRICNQTWTAKNLNVSHYRNGDIIPQVTDPAQWASLTTGAWCWYNNDSVTYGATYGKLYNWYAVNDPRGLAPEGWHVPSDGEWTELTNCLGGLSVAGGKLKEAGTVHWSSPNTGATNSSGYLGLPGGYRNDLSTFGSVNINFNWWSSSESNSQNSFCGYIYYSNSNVVFGDINKKYGFSVRCIKDTIPSTLTNGLVAYYPFNGNANDESGNGNNGTVYGATLTADRFGNNGKAYSLTGSTSVPSYIIGDCSNFPSSNRTVSFWFYANDIGVGTAGRALLGYGGQTCGQSWLMNIDNYGNGGNNYEVQGHCQNQQVLYSYGYTHPNGSWIHWVITTDNVNGTNFYINGVNVKTDPTFINQTYVLGKKFIFGAYVSNDGNSYGWDGNCYPFNGKLDDIRIYNRALTQEEITYLATH